MRFYFFRHQVGFLSFHPLILILFMLCAINFVLRDMGMQFTIIIEIQKCILARDEHVGWCFWIHILRKCRMCLSKLSLQSERIETLKGSQRQRTFYRYPNLVFPRTQRITVIVQVKKEDFFLHMGQCPFFFSGREVCIC